MYNKMIIHDIKTRYLAKQMVNISFQSDTAVGNSEAA